MVQVDESISYDPNMNESGQDWSKSVRDAVAAFTRQVGDSSQQLAAAADRFASESMKAIDDSSRKAEAHATRSSDAASAAGAAAAEARQMTETLRGMLSDAAERVKQETNAFFQDAVRQIEQSGTSSREKSEELQQKLDATVSQIESSVTAARDFASQAALAAQEARQSAIDLGSDHGQVAQAAETAAEISRVTATELASLRSEIANNERAADEERAAHQESARAALTEVASLREALAATERIASEAAAEAARSAAGEVASLRETIEAAEKAAKQAAVEAARAANSEMISLKAMVAGAERSAADARQVALEATQLAQQNQPPVEQTVSLGAQEVLERLEADYSLLTKLVQELHARIASLSAQTSPVYQFVPPSQRQEADVNHSLPELPELAETEASQPGDETVAEMEQEEAAHSSWDDATIAAAESWSSSRYNAEPASEPEATEEPDPAHDETPEVFAEPVHAEEESPAIAEEAAAPTAEAESEPATPTIAGRVLVSISPVPDFDRLLSLDGALGRMSGIGNVTLADYAREEVTFRVEVDPPTSVEDFRNRLSVSAGASIEVVASGNDGLALRLAS